MAVTLAEGKPIARERVTLATTWTAVVCPSWTREAAVYNADTTITIYVANRTVNGDGGAADAADNYQTLIKGARLEGITLAPGRSRPANAAATIYIRAASGTPIAEVEASV